MMMMLRLWSKVHDGRLCTCCSRDALYVMNIHTRNATIVIRFCQHHIDEMRTMFGADAKQFYPKEDADV